VNICNYWLQRTFQQQIATKMARDRPRQLAYGIFSIKRRF